MPEREKVIGKLQFYVNICREDERSGEDLNGLVLHPKYVEDAIALLKEMEPVEPLRINHDTKWQRDIECICGECCGSFYRLKVNFCPWCGKAVKWE